MVDVERSFWDAGVVSGDVHLREESSFLNFISSLGSMPLRLPKGLGAVSREHVQEADCTFT